MAETKHHISIRMMIALYPSKESSSNNKIIAIKCQIETAVKCSEAFSFIENMTQYVISLGTFFEKKNKLIQFYCTFLIG